MVSLGEDVGPRGIGWLRRGRRCQACRARAARPAASAAAASATASVPERGRPRPASPCVRGTIPARCLSSNPRRPHRTRRRSGHRTTPRPAARVVAARLHACHSRLRAHGGAVALRPMHSWLVRSSGKSAAPQVARPPARPRPQRRIEHGFRIFVLRLWGHDNLPPTRTYPYASTPYQRVELLHGPDRGFSQPLAVPNSTSCFGTQRRQRHQKRASRGSRRCPSALHTVTSAAAALLALGRPPSFGLAILFSLYVL